MTLFDLAGWIGGIAVATGYVLASLHRLDPAGRTYQALNVIGGLLLTVTALYRFAYPNMIINLVWITFGFYALLRTFRRRCHAAAEDAETGANEAAVPSALEVSIGKPRRDR